MVVVVALAELWLLNRRVIIRLLERSVKNSVKFTFSLILLQLHFGDNVTFPHHNKLTTGVSVTFTWAPVSSVWQYLLWYVVVSPLAVLQAPIFHSLLAFVMEMSFFLLCLCSVKFVKQVQTFMLCSYFYRILFSGAYFVLCYKPV